jgi:tryptophan-rich sensory protein
VDWFSQKPRETAATLSHLPSQRKEEMVNTAENPAFNAPAKVAGIAYLICICGFGIAVTTIFIHKESWKLDVISFLAVLVLIFGPIFAAIVWGTHRHFRRKRRVNE